MTDTPDALSDATKASFTQSMLAAGRSQADVDAALAPVQPAPMDFNGKQFSDAASADEAIAKSRAETETRVRQNILDATAGPSPEGAEYSLRFDDLKGLDLSELADVRAMVTKGFAAAGVPSAAAQPMLDAMISSTDQAEALSGAALAIWTQTQQSQIDRLPGGKAEQLRLAAVFTSKLPSATFKELVEAHAFSSARAVSMAANIGRMIEYRQKAQGKMT